LEPRNLAKIDDDNINKKAALVKHVIFNDHKIDWTNCKIFCPELDYSKRRFLESFYINQNVHAVNVKNNCFYSKVYDSIPFLLFTISYIVYGRSITT